MPAGAAPRPRCRRRRPRPAPTRRRWRTSSSSAPTGFPDRCRHPADERRGPLVGRRRAGGPTGAGGGSPAGSAPGSTTSSSGDRATEVVGERRLDLASHLLAAGAVGLVGQPEDGVVAVDVHESSSLEQRLGLGPQAADDMVAPRLDQARRGDGKGGCDRRHRRIVGTLRDRIGSSGRCRGFRLGGTAGVQWRLRAGSGRHPAPGLRSTPGRWRPGRWRPRCGGAASRAAGLSAPVRGAGDSGASVGAAGCGGRDPAGLGSRARGGSTARSGGRDRMAPPPSADAATERHGRPGIRRREVCDSSRSIRASSAAGESSASGWVRRTRATSRLTRGSGASRMATWAWPSSSMARTRVARPTRSAWARRAHPARPRTPSRGRERPG